MCNHRGIIAALTVVTVSAASQRKDTEVAPLEAHPLSSTLIRRDRPAVQDDNDEAHAVIDASGELILHHQHHHHRGESIAKHTPQRGDNLAFPNRTHLNGSYNGTIPWTNHSGSPAHPNRTHPNGSDSGTIPWMDHSDSPAYPNLTHLNGSYNGTIPWTDHSGKVHNMSADNNSHGNWSSLHNTSARNHSHNHTHRHGAHHHSISHHVHGKKICAEHTDCPHGEFCADSVPAVCAACALCFHDDDAVDGTCPQDNCPGTPNTTYHHDHHHQDPNTSSANASNWSSPNASNVPVSSSSTPSPTTSTTTTTTTTVTPDVWSDVSF